MQSNCLALQPELTGVGSSKSECCGTERDSGQHVHLVSFKQRWSCAILHLCQERHNQCGHSSWRGRQGIYPRLPALGLHPGPWPTPTILARLEPATIPHASSVLGKTNVSTHIYARQACQACQHGPSIAKTSLISVKQWAFLFLQREVKPAYGSEKNTLLLWGDAPRWEYSTAPLMDSDGHPVAWPDAGSGGHAMHFNDQQVGALT